MAEPKKIDLKAIQDSVELTEEEYNDIQEGSHYMVSSNIKLDFRRFVTMLRSHDLSSVMEDYEEDEKYIIVPADVLADISNAEMAIQKKAATTNVYSSFLIYGMGIGGFLAIIVSLALVAFEITIAPRDLIIVGAILLCGLILPFLIIASEPAIKDFQNKHRDYLERMTEFLSRR